MDKQCCAHASKNSAWNTKWNNHSQSMQKLWNKETAALSWIVIKHSVFPVPIQFLHSFHHENVFSPYKYFFSCFFVVCLQWNDGIKCYRWYLQFWVYTIQCTTFVRETSNSTENVLYQFISFCWYCTITSVDIAHKIISLSNCILFKHL